MPESGPRKIAFVSCNKMNTTIANGKIPGSEDLWETLWGQVQAGDVDLVLHMGDQVYADDDGPGGITDVFHSTFDTAKRLVIEEMRSPTCSEAELAQRVRHLYRKTYRATLTHPPTRRVLAHVPNLAVDDDHETADNLGDSSSDRDAPEASPIKIVTRQAMRIYCEYFMQLHMEMDFSSFEVDEGVGAFHAHCLGDIGILFTETRFAKVLGRQPEDVTVPYLGRRQWDLIDHALSEDGLFARCQFVICVTPTPLIFLAKDVNWAMSQIAADLKGHWCCEAYEPEQCRLLESLDRWRSLDRTHRDVILLGGDVHMGGFTEISMPAHPEDKIHQITSSPISNEEFNQVILNTTKTGQGAVSKLLDGATFVHKDWTGERNYGLLNIALRERRLQASARLVTPRLHPTGPLSWLWCCSDECFGGKQGHTKERVVARAAPRSKKSSGKKND
jgi:hypothetical protein